MKPRIYPCLPKIEKKGSQQGNSKQKVFHYREKLPCAFVFYFCKFLYNFVSTIKNNRVFRKIAANMYYVDDIKINVRIATEFKLRLVVILILTIAVAKFANLT